MRRKNGLSQREISAIMSNPVGSLIFGIILTVAGFFIPEDMGIPLVVIGMIIGIVGIIGIAIKYSDEDEGPETQNEKDWGNAKKQPPVYQLSNVDYNPNTRQCKITFYETEKYRTVERYVTRNYVKYPILSDWKTKAKYLTYSIKFTNSAIEELIDHDDFLIRKFAFEIIQRIKSYVPLPSWYKIQEIENEYSSKINDNNVKIDREQSCFTTAKNVSEQHISKLNSEVKELEQLLKKQEKVKINTYKKLQKSTQRKKSVFLNILTFGIYAVLTSSRHIKKLSEKAQKASDNYDYTDKKIALLKDNIKSEENSIIAIKEATEQECAKLKEANEKLRAEKAEKKSSVIPLAAIVEDAYEFIPLSHFVGMDYEKVVGIYIIQNNENKKCYVGQSKDIFRRIKQHFKGTVPNNIIFAEDYYNSAYTDKSTLFSIMIVECEKWELDEQEKYYINEFNSYKKGYNSTQGNNE